MFSMLRPMSVTEANVANVTLMVFAWNDVFWMGWVGVNVLTGGPGRLSGPGYTKLNEIAAFMEVDTQLLLGIPILTAAVCLAAGLFLDGAVGLILRITAFTVGAMCAGSLFGLFEAAAAANPNAGNLGGPTFFFTTVFQLAMLAGTVLLQGIRPITSQSKE